MRQIIALVLIILWVAPAEAEVRVIASTSDLAYFARAIGGEYVEVESIASPRADLHFVEVRPTYMVKARRANLALTVGLGLDAWMQKIIDGSRNDELIIVDCSKYVERLEIPHAEMDARHGDIHAEGNPHYWLSPANVGPVVRAIAEGLKQVAPEYAASFEANRVAYLDQLNSQLPSLRHRAAPLAGKRIVYYHNSWPYFNAFTGVVASAFVEPYPGVPPSPSHVADLIEHLERESLKIIALEPYFDHRVPNRLAAATGAAVIELYPSVGGREAGESYIEFLQGNIDALLEALP